MEMMKNAQIKTVKSFQKVEVSPTTISTYGATDNLYILMRLQGFLMPHRHKYAYVVYAAFVIVGITLYVPFGFTKGFFGNKNLTNDIGAFFTTLQVAINVCGGSVKVLLLGLMLGKLHATRAMINKLDARCQDVDEKMEQKNIVLLGRRIVIVILSIYLAYATMTCIGAVMIGRPPYSLYLPYINWRNSRWEFWIATLLEFFMIDMVCIEQALNDSYPVVYICMLRAHLRILKLRISKLGISPNLDQEERTEQLKMCIKDHKMLLEFQNSINPVISITIFIQFSLTALMLGTTLINFMLFSTDLSMRLGSCLYIASVFAQTFPLCYFAQCLQSESAELCDRIFHSHWFDQSLQYRKILIIFMQRTQCLIEFTAGKLFPINLGSFISIVKFSFSLYTLIETMDIQF